MLYNPNGFQRIPQDVIFSQHYLVVINFLHHFLLCVEISLRVRLGVYVSYRLKVYLFLKFNPNIQYLKTLSWSEANYNLQNLPKLSIRQL